MKSPIKATLITYDTRGNQIKKPKRVFCHFASNENPPIVEVYLGEDKEDINQSILIDWKSLVRELGL